MADAPGKGWPKGHDEIAIKAGFRSWVVWIDHLEGHTKAGEPRRYRRKICGAKIPRGVEGRSDADTPCCLLAGAASTGSSPKQTGHKGFGRCGSHGGLSLIHPESKRSVYHTTGRLAELAQIHETELEVKKEIHVLELLIARDLERLPEDAITPRSLVSLIDSLGQSIQKAERTQDFRDVTREAARLRGDLEDITLYWRLMDQVRKNMDLKRKMVDTHVRQVAREHGPVTWHDVSIIMEEMRRDVRTIIDEFIDDPVKRSQAIKIIQSQTEPGRGPNRAIIP